MYFRPCCSSQRDMLSSCMLRCCVISVACLRVIIIVGTGIYDEKIPILYNWKSFNFKKGIFWKIWAVAHWPRVPRAICSLKRILRKPLRYGNGKPPLDSDNPKSPGRVFMHNCAHGWPQLGALGSALRLLNANCQMDESKVAKPCTCMRPWLLHKGHPAFVKNRFGAGAAEKATTLLIAKRWLGDRLQMGDLPRNSDTVVASTGVRTSVDP